MLQKCIENWNILSNETEKREQDILLIKKDRNLYFEEKIDKLELENTDDKWEEVKTLTGIIQNHNCEMKRIQLKMKELETQVKIVDENLFFFRISQSVKNEKNSSSRVVLKNRKTGLILSFV